MKKQKFKRRFIRNTFTRFHMSLILFGTILSGVIFSKLLLNIGLQNMLIRFSLVLGLTYLCFLLLMKLWLNYLTKPYRDNEDGSGVLDAADVLSDIPDLLSTSDGHAIQGQGGEFGGAGVSGAWNDGTSGTSLPVPESAGGISESIGETTAKTAGEAISSLGDEGGILLIPLILLILGVLGGGVYLIYEAPMILSEAAFELILATTLIKKAKKIDNPNWMGSVFQSTWLALLFTWVITLIAGWGLMTYCPQATKIKEVFQYCL